jgi:predicted TIM-barrel fold metal-dependent hydrolase
MLDWPLISADSHVIEPSDLWSTRIDRYYQDRAPRLINEGEYVRWVADSRFQMGNLGGVGAAGVRFEQPDTLSLSLRGSYADLPRGGHDPDARMIDLDREGVAIEVLHPSVAVHAYRIPDSGLVSAIFRAYNDWLAQFCASHPTRLKGLALLNIDDVEAGVAELERCARLGMIGAIIPVAPGPAHRYSEPVFDRLWAAAGALATPLTLHVGTKRCSAEVESLEQASASKMALINRDSEIREVVAELILSGVVERFSDLRLICSEYELSWVPHFLFRLDNYYRHRPLGRQGHRFADDQRPSDLFRRSFHVSFQEDPYGFAHLDAIGPHAVLWGSDYPHAESTFPRSREILADLLAHVPEALHKPITADNAARVYGLR